LDVLGSDGSWAICNYYLRNWYSDPLPNPLYSYHLKAIPSGKTINLEPVDYWVLEQVRRAFNDYYGERAANRLSEIVGLEWWSYLNDLIGNNIIPPYTYSKLHSEDLYKLTPPQFTEHRIRLAVSNFAKKMKSSGGVLVALDEFDTGMQITFSECPFCANGLPACNILFGVVQGMLLHLFGIPPLIKDVSGKPFFDVTSEKIHEVQYQLVENDSHVVQLKFAQASRIEG
jgi:hypothetical protein